MRAEISQYTLDKRKAPESLDELIHAGYIKQIPVDPMTGSNQTWVVDAHADGTEIHSGSRAVGSDGVPYSRW